MDVLVSALNGEPPRSLARDPAVKLLPEARIPVVVAAAGRKSIANAGRLGLGIAPPGKDDESIRVFEEYRAPGGTGPTVLNRGPWLGAHRAGIASHGEHPEGDIRWWETESSSRKRTADLSWMKDDPKRVQGATTASLLAAELNRSIARCSATCVSIRL